MKPIRATQLWILGILVGLVATAVVARLAKDAWPELRSVSAATLAAPGVALAFVLLLLLRKRLVEHAKRAARRGL